MRYAFSNREEAGKLLGLKLRKFKDEKGIVFAVPRGGVPVAYYAAKEINFPLEVILTKKIGHPANKEYAIGAASLTDYFVIPHDDVTEEYIVSEVALIRNRLNEMYRKFVKDDPLLAVNGKTVIIVDDGIATGNTLLATIRLLKKHNPGKLIIAVPVASESAVEKLEKEVDEVITILIPKRFSGVGEFYEDFSPLTDEDVIFYLDKLREFKNAV